MTKTELLALCKQADSTQDMDKAEALFDEILSEPGLSLKLTASKILDIKWNRAVNLEDIADWYLTSGYSNRPQPIRAHTCIKIAISGILDCVNGYTTTKAISQSHSFLRELREKQSEIEQLVEQKTATLPQMMAP